MYTIQSHTNTIKKTPPSHFLPQPTQHQQQKSQCFLVFCQTYRHPIYIIYLYIYISVKHVFREIERESENSVRERVPRAGQHVSECN